MYYEYVKGADEFIREQELQLKEDLYMIERIRIWVLVAITPLVIAIIYFGSRFESGYYGMGYVLCFVGCGIGQICYSIYCKKFVTKEVDRIEKEAHIYKQQWQQPPLVGVNVNEGTVSITVDEMTNTYNVDEIKKVVFGHHMILFILNNGQIFSIAIERTVDIYVQLRDKVKCRVYEMVSLKRAGYTK